MPSLPRIVLAQINPTVGDIEGNLALIARAYAQAAEEGADILLTPECCLIGYPVEDLVLHPAFRAAAMEAGTRLAALTAGQPCLLIAGSLWQEEGDEAIYNAALCCGDGRIHAVVRKHELPNESVFDEKRVFASAPLPDIVEWRGWRLGVLVCRDLWFPHVTAHLAAQGAQVLLAINASPFYAGKDAVRQGVARAAATAHGLPVVYLNQSGGQDELVFDGASFVMDARGEVTHQLPHFSEVLSAPLVPGEAPATPYAGGQEDSHDLRYRAMMTGLRDYVHKNGFTQVVLGLSGGIDSALTAVLAADALGANRVRTVMLPSPYTAAISLEDARALAEALGMRHDVLPITQGMEAVADMLDPLAPEVPNALAQENIQSRLRGLLLMAISNSTGALLLSTGNKSELATGYATLYGDMCGAYNVLKDLYKTEVFALSHWRNAHIPEGAQVQARGVMPPRILTRPPSAELRDNQKDEDSLPPYDVLDAILALLIEERSGVEEAVASGHARETVERVARLLRISEYKRRQAPPGVKLTPLSFGRDWRMPLTNRYEG